MLNEFWKGKMIHLFLSLSVRFNFCQEFTFFLNHNFNYKNYSKINISYTLGVEIKNHLHKTLFIEDFPTIPRKQPNFLEILILILLDFQWENCSLFNDSYTISLSLDAPLLMEGFLLIPRVWQGFCGLGDVNLTKQNKANKLPSLIMDHTFV